LPPIVALVACLAFIGYVLRKDIKEADVSSGLWVPFVWIAVSASRPFSSWLHPGNLEARTQNFNYLEGNPTERVFLIVLIVAGLTVLYRRRRRFSLPFRGNVAMYLFYIFALLSVGWADYQGVSIKRWIRGIGDIIMVLVVLTEDDEKEAIERVLRRTAIVLIPLSVIFVKYFRHYGVVFLRGSSPMWVGVSTHKNNLALLCAFSALLLIWRILKKWPRPDLFDALLLLMALYLLQGTSSATSYIVVLLGIAVLTLEAMTRGNPKRLNGMIVGCLLLLLVFNGLMVSASAVSASNLLFKAVGRNRTFTDRVPLWQDLIKIGGRNPVGGAGFGGFWLGSLTGLWARHTWRPTNGHNGYVDVFLDLGVVGLVIMGFLIVRTYVKARDSIEDEWGIRRLLLAFVVMILVHNVTESSLAMPTNYLWLLFLMAAITVARKAGPPEKPENATGVESLP
jgi:exopolysaccharide production protein ExoQ